MILQTRSAKLVSLSDQVYEYLRLGIISGEVAQGEKLVEMDIAAQVGTSQGPVREALQRLAADHLVEIVARRAILVSRMGVEEQALVLGRQLHVPRVQRARRLRAREHGQERQADHQEERRSAA